MPINTNTDMRVELALSEYQEFRRSFWHRAAHYDSDSPLMIEADATLRKRAVRLINVLQEMLNDQD